MWDSIRVLHTPFLRDSAFSLRFVAPSLKRTRGAALIPSIMTQPRPDKILSVLGLNKAHTILLMWCPCTSKRILPIKVWITPYKPSISFMLCRYGFRLGCYISVMTQSRPNKILSALGLNKARTIFFFLGCP